MKSFKSAIGSLRSDRYFAIFFRSVRSSVLLRLGWAVANYASVVVLARVLDIEDFGTFSFVISLVIFLSILGGMGSQPTVIRFLGQYQAQSNFPRARGVMNYFLRRVILSSGTLATLGVAVSVTLDFLGYLNNPLPIILGFAILPAFTLLDTQAGIARSFRAIFLALAPKDILWRLSLIAIALGVGFLFPPGHKLEWILLFAAVSMTGLSFWQHWRLKKLVPDEMASATPEDNRKEWSDVALPLWISLIAAKVFTTVDVLLVNLFVDKASAGLYFAASRTAILVSFVPMVANLVVAPEISHLHFGGDYMRLRKLLKLAALMVFVPSLSAFLACLFFGPQLLSIFGREFIAAHAILVILAGAHAISAAMGCVRPALSMTGHQKVSAQIQVASSIMAAGAIFALTYRYGAIGAAWAVFFGIVLNNLWQWIYARRLARIDPSIFCFMLGQPKHEPPE